MRGSPRGAHKIPIRPPSVRVSRPSPRAVVGAPLVRGGEGVKAWGRLGAPRWERVREKAGVSAPLPSQRMHGGGASSFFSLVVDIGSSSVRCTAIPSAGGRGVVAAAAARRPNALSRQGTMDAAAVLVACTDCVAECQAALPLSAVVSDVMVACVAMSLVGVDATTGIACTPVLTYAGRGGEEDGGSSLVRAVSRLRGEGLLDARSYHDRVGAPLHPAYAPAQVAAYAGGDGSSSRDLLAGLVWCSLPTLLLAKWTGRHPRDVGTSRSEASWAGLLNLATQDFDAEALAAVGLSAASLPPIRPSAFHITLLRGSSSGGTFPRLRPADEARFWLGVGDGAAAAVGSGALDRPTLALTVGTSAALRAVLPWARAAEVLCLGGCRRGGGGEKEAAAPAPASAASSPSPHACAECSRLRLSSLGLWAYPFSDTHVLVGGALTDGGSLVDYMTTALGADVGTIDAQVRSNGLLCLPFWSGERSTGWRGEASGCLYGLSYEHTRAHILAAAMEGVAFRLRAILERLALVLPHAEPSWHVVGSGAGLTRSPLWAQVIADVLGVEVEVAAESGGSSSAAAAAVEATTLGAYLLARLHAPVEEGGGGEAHPAAPPAAAAGGGVVATVYRPDPSMAARYDALYPRHTLLYDALAPIHAKLK
jgi:gluconokinase